MTTLPETRPFLDWYDIWASHRKEEPDGTARDGWIRAELVNAPDTPPQPVRPFPGFSADACEPLCGDPLDEVARWRGSGDLSALADREVSVRLHLRRAKVYAAGW